MLRGRLGGHMLVATENLHHAKLLVCNTHNAHIAFFRQLLFHPLYVHIGIFLAVAMAHVYAELKHLKTVGHHILTEFSGALAVFFCVSGADRKR